MKCTRQWTYLPPLPSYDCSVDRQEEQSESKGGRKKKERKVSDNDTVRGVYQICYRPGIHPEY